MDEDIMCRIGLYCPILKSAGLLYYVLPKLIDVKVLSSLYAGEIIQ